MATVHALKAAKRLLSVPLLVTRELVPLFTIIIFIYGQKYNVNY